MARLVVRLEDGSLGGPYEMTKKDNDMFGPWHKNEDGHMVLCGKCDEFMVHNKFMHAWYCNKCGAEATEYMTYPLLYS